MCVSVLYGADIPLTHLCQINFPMLINWMSPFPILGLLGGIFSFLFKFKKKLLFANSGEHDQNTASDLVLHCLLMSHKNGARLIWVNPLASRLTKTQ